MREITRTRSDRARERHDGLCVPERIAPAVIADGAEEAVNRALSGGTDGGAPDVTSVQEGLASLVDERGSRLTALSTASSGAVCRHGW